MTIRVAQWATGGVGKQALRMILDDPELELVGVVVHDPEKVGRDAGELSDRAHTGVAATTAAVDHVLDAHPDVVVHCPLPSAQMGLGPNHDTEVIATMLGEGVDVVTTVGYVWPWAYDDGRAERLEGACAAGGSTLHGTGLNPGFQNELVPLVLSRLSGRIDKVYVRESSTFERYPSSRVVLEIMGMGRPPSDGIDEVYRAWLDGLFRESVLLLAAGLGVELDSIETDVELAVATEDRGLASGVVHEGTVDGQRWTWSGRRHDREVILLEAVYRAHHESVPGWAHPGYYIEIEGRPVLRLDVGHWIDRGLLGTAAMAVNAVAAVNAAEPGIRTVLDLPLITGRGRLAT